MHYEIYAPPQEQYVDFLVRRKLKAIGKSPVSDIINRFITIKITLNDISSDLFNRVVELPAGIYLF